MKRWISVVERIVMVASLGGIVGGEESAFGQTNEAVSIFEKSGTVEFLQNGAANWQRANNDTLLYPLDQVRTGPNSSLGLLWSDRSVSRIAASTELEILPAAAAETDHRLNLLQGLLSFFHRDKPNRIQVFGGGTFAGIKGTEFVMEVSPAGSPQRTTLSVLDGAVVFSNSVASLILTNGEQAVSESGAAPRRTSGFVADNLLQWCFYYPGVLDLDDLPLSPEESEQLGESMAAYRAGDLLAALAEYPGRPHSDAERIYHAMLLLAGSQVAPAEADLDALTERSVSGRTQRLAEALRTLIAAVKHTSRAAGIPPQLPTELLAASYYAQSRPGPDSLSDALTLACRAATIATTFGFAGERVAELEFSFGRTDRARVALEKALRVSPRNAQALALNGFLFAAQNRPRAAIDWFDRALAVDSALGNAWLGRGLCRIRLGDTKAGRTDLLIAAAMEPQRATLRNYLGKAFGDAGDAARANHELGLAQELDPQDPTPWLYLALLDEQDNRINEAIRDLENSQELNENRSVYRSRQLLQEDQAVRSANLARIYDEAGLDEIALNEAGQSVAEDYASYNSHLFLANAYQQSAPAGPFAQRYQTAAYSEYLITALLGPPDGRILSQAVSQQEYSRLFEQDGAHLSSSTEYDSNGAWKQYAAQYGTFGNTSYAVEGDYVSDPGQVANSRLDEHDVSAKIKQQLTAKDSIVLEVSETRFEGGDTSQHYDPAETLANYHFTDVQSPSVLLGYHREWSPGSHSLFMFSRFSDQPNFFDPASTAVLLLADPGQPPVNAAVTDLTRSFQRHYIANTVELQQIQEVSSHTLIAGARFQLNTDHVVNQDAALGGNLTGGAYNGFFPQLPYTFPAQDIQVENDRASLYAFDYWQVNDEWLLFGGLDADYLRLAQDTSDPPLSTDHDTIAKLSPKAGVLWKPCRNLDLSLAYAQSVTGEDLDQSIRLEPSDFVGAPLAFRTAFPESLFGDLSGEKINVWQASGRIRLGKNTYGVLGFQDLQSHVDHEVGSYTSPFTAVGQPVPSTTGESLRFHEDSLQFSLRHLFDDIYSTGVRYEVSRARLTQAYAIDPSIFIPPSQGTSLYEGILHTFSLDALANFPVGLFAGADATWRLQNDLTDTTLGGQLPDDNFWQLNIYGGYRSPHRRFEVTIALLNLTGSDYRLDPINAYPDLPRRLTLALTTQFNF